MSPIVMFSFAIVKIAYTRIAVISLKHNSIYTCKNFNYMASYANL